MIIITHIANFTNKKYSLYEVTWKYKLLECSILLAVIQSVIKQSSPFCLNGGNSKQEIKVIATILVNT